MFVFAIAMDRAMAFTPWLLRSMMSPVLEKRLEVDRVWPLYLITGQKKNIRVYQCSYQRLSAAKSGKSGKSETGGKGLVVDSGSRNNTSRNILTFFRRHAKHEVTIEIRLAREVK
ncbi:hypothetical protein [Syntrophorhabdus aromaticivorans]|uniref:hypothetical protein n=1 Tax=Syntrophorhabdus aromaticivorans TaxID=328301 RepID=UPI0004231E08|nr:hypothetical protein [Syntrophorhabdus aromaticivorans]